MKLSYNIQSKFNKILHKVFTRKQGISGRADPTAWTSYEAQFGPVSITLSGSWEIVAKVYHKGRCILFVSSAINKWLHSLTTTLYDLLDFDLWAEPEEPYEGDYSHLYPYG